MFAASFAGSPVCNRHAGGMEPADAWRF